MFGPGFFVGIAVGGVIVLVMSIVALTRKADARTAQPTRRTIAIASPLPPDAAFKALQSAAPGRSRLGDSDSSRRALVFVSPMTLMSWGFFYPVFVSASGGGSNIAVGIKSRALQWGPLVSKNHKQFAAELERALPAR